MNKCINEEMLKIIEEFLEYKLPDDYRKFILNVIPSDLENKCFNFKESEDGSVISEFLDFKNGFMTNILVRKKYLEKRIPSNTLAIARDTFGNLILISVKGKDRGKIYFWDHEQEADTDNGEVANYSNLTLIADTFQEFLDDLHEYDDARDGG